MLSISQMETIRHQFDSFCRKVLREESRNLKMQYARRAEREVALSQLSEKQLQGFSTEDRYPSDVICFEVGRYRVSVQDERRPMLFLSCPKRKETLFCWLTFWT